LMVPVSLALARRNHSSSSRTANRLSIQRRAIFLLGSVGAGIESVNIRHCSEVAFARR
jgi:hypothetical protein